MANNDYWNNYYKRSDIVAAPQAPSQFAAFVLTELVDMDTQIIDFGCGNGRDAFFFGRHGYSVIGVDGSKTAVDNCIATKLPNTEFVFANIGDSNLTNTLVRKLDKNRRDGITAYARFFIHAIDDNTQLSFLKAIKNIIGHNGRAAFEFRTNRDINQIKVTPDHYRRFVSALDFMTVLNKLDFKVNYFVEGFGYAKYSDDDAHVARFIVESK